MKQRIIIALSLCVITSIFLLSCVDVNQPNFTTQNYRALMRIVNLASDAQATAPVTMDGKSIGNLAYQQSTAYLDVPAGGRKFSFAGNSQDLTFNTNQQGTVFITSDTGGRFFLSGEGLLTTNPAVLTGDTAAVKFLNLAKGFSPNISFFEGSDTGALLGTSGYKADAPYANVSTGSHTIVAVSPGGYKASLTGAQEVPPVSTLDSGNATFTLDPVAGLTYTINVVSANFAGVDNAFYTGAELHTGAAGATGPVIQTLALDTQAISFPKVTFSGTNEPTPDSSTQATGSGTFSIVANAARDSFTLNYDITLTPDTTDTTHLQGAFISGRLYQGAPGSTGTPIFTLFTGPTDTVTTLTGTWSTGDTPPLTRALVDAFLHGQVFAEFHTTRKPTGEIRGQIVPDSTSSTSVAGTWSDIPDSLKNAFVAGNVYVNFLTAAHPSGQIRGQVSVDPAQGQFGVGTLTDTSGYRTGRTYTVVAYNEGNTLRLIKVANRQAGLPKPAAEAPKRMTTTMKQVKK